MLEMYKKWMHNMTGGSISPIKSYLCFHLSLFQPLQILCIPRKSCWINGLKIDKNPNYTDTFICKNDCPR